MFKRDVSRTDDANIILFILTEEICDNVTQLNFGFWGRT